MPLPFMAQNLPTTPDDEPARRKERRAALRLMWLVFGGLSWAVWNYCFHSDREGKMRIADKLYLKNHEYWAEILVYVVFFVALAVVGGYSKIPENRWLKSKAVLKFFVSALPPGLCLVLGNICKNDFRMFLFFVSYAVCILFFMLGFTASEDFGFSDMLVSVSMGFITGPIYNFWKYVLLGMIFSVKAFFPLYKKKYGEKPPNDSMLADLEPLFRATNWEVERVSREEALVRVRSLEANISEALKKVEEIKEAAEKARTNLATLSREVASFKSRL